MYVITNVVNFRKGVEKVDADVETKSVVVTCDEGVDSAVLLEALQKWSASSGKPVELVA
jgi:copper chaperone CopZ